MHKQMAARLAANERKKKAIDIGLLILVIGGTLLLGAISYDNLKSPQDSWVGIALKSIVPGVFLARFLILPPGKMLAKWYEHNLAPSWIIEQGDGVIKVHGSIPVLDWQMVENKVLSLRSGYALVDDAWARFGCTMAAVPRSGSATVS